MGEMDSKIAIRNIVIFLIFLFGFNYFSKDLYKLFSNNKSTKEISNSTWTIRKYGDPMIEIESPVELKEKEVNIPGNVKEIFKTVRAYSYNSDGNLCTSILTYRFSKDIELDVTDFADKQINDLANKMGFKNLKYAARDYSTGENKRIELSGTFDLKGRSHIINV